MPRRKTTTRTLYPLDALSDTAQARAHRALAKTMVDEHAGFARVIDNLHAFGLASGVGCTYDDEFECTYFGSMAITNCRTTLSALRAKREACQAFPKVSTEVIEPFFARFTATEGRQLARLERAGYLGSLYGSTRSATRSGRAEIDRYDTHPERTPRMSALLDKLAMAWADLLTNLADCYLALLAKEYDTIRARTSAFTADGRLASPTRR